MANTPHLDSAKIYQFPIRTRSRGQNASETQASTHASVVSLPSRRAANTSFASSGYDAWYHETAIREAEREKDH